MEQDAFIAPETLRPVDPHGEVDDDELANVRVDGPEPDENAVAPNTNREAG